MSVKKIENRESYLQLFIYPQRSGDPGQDVFTFLNTNGCPDTAHHCAAVAGEARRVAQGFGIDADQAEMAGWLHDVSAVWSVGERLGAAEALGIEVLPEERAAPFILHQKLSTWLARELFGITDCGVLSAVACHTTLKAGVSALDKVVFVADKLAWDQPGQAPYHPALRAGLAVSLNEACRVYLRYLWARRIQLDVLHPWFVQAYHELCCED